MTLSDEDSELNEGSMTYTEALAALRKMKNNTSPGSDGCLVEIFNFLLLILVMFWCVPLMVVLLMKHYRLRRAKVLLHVFLRKKNQSNICRISVLFHC